MKLFYLIDASATFVVSFACDSARDKLYIFGFSFLFSTHYMLKDFAAAFVALIIREY